VRTRRLDRIGLQLLACWPGVATLLLAAPPAPAAPKCGTERATATDVGKPAATAAWRAELIARTRLWRFVPKQGDKSHGAVGPRDAAALLVLRAARDSEGRCWLRVRLPSRPNNATAWVRADRVVLRPTRWRIVVAPGARTISVYHDGDLRRRFRVVVGAPGTPTPRGQFSIVGVWRWNPADFLGSYILPLTAHSKALQEFGGGDGRVGIHGRGGASLVDPLGSARSHGCIRLSNKAINWIVRKVGARGLPGVPVRVR
jgi:L,D-transpeptidase catalytic domain